MRIAFETWPVSGQRVWTFTNSGRQLFVLAPFGPLTNWNVYGWPGELGKEGFEFPTRRQAIKFVYTLLNWEKGGKRCRELS